MNLYVNVYPKVVKDLNIIGNIPGIFLKKPGKSWKYHGILSVQKCGNPEETSNKKMATTGKAVAHFNVDLFKWPLRGLYWL